jgi:hypothetical protein
MEQDAKIQYAYKIMNVYNTASYLPYQYRASPVHLILLDPILLNFAASLENLLYMKRTVINETDYTTTSFIATILLVVLK